MCDQSEIEYKAGEVVWCKLGNLWWPAQVQDQDGLDEEVTQGLRKRPLAVVKFFNEDFYDFVKDIKHICHYNSSRKLEFIRKGMDSYRSMGKTNQMSKFPQDIIMAEEITGGNVNILDDPRLAPEEKVSYKDVFNTPKTLKENKIVKRSKNVSVKGKLLSRYSPAFGKPGYEKNYFTKYLIQKCITPNNIQYHCPDCSFVCSRLVLLSYHRSYNKFHGCPKTPLKFIKANSSLHKIEKTVIKRKSVGNDTSPLKKKSKPPIKGPNDEPPKKIIKVKAVVKQETKEKDKKKAEAMREQLLLDWNEEEGEESDDVAQDVSDTVESKLEEKPAGQSINTSLATSCFDFEDNEEDMNMDRSIRFGQKLPRVIPKEDKTKDGKLKEKNASQDDGLEEEFNNLMKETVVPIMTDPFLLDSSALPDSTGKAEANLGSKANNEEEDMKDTGGNETKVTQPPSEVDLFKKSDDDNSSLLRALESDSPAEFEQKEYSGKSLKRCNSSSLSEKIAKKLKSDADLLASLRSDSDSNSSPPENLVTDKDNFSYISFDKPSENLDNVSSENIQIEGLDNSTPKENEVTLSKTRFSRRRSCSSKYNEKNVQTSEVISLEKSSTQKSYGMLNKDEHDIEPSKSGECNSKSNKEKSPRKIMPARRCSTSKAEPSSTTKVVLKSIPNKKNSISPAKIGTKGTKGRLESEKSGPIRRSSTRRSTSSSQPENNSDETSNSLPEESVEKRIAMLLSDSSSESPNDPLPSCKRPSPSSMAKCLAVVKEKNMGKHSKDKRKSANNVEKSSLLDARKRRLNKLLLEKRRGMPAGKKTDIHDNSMGRGHKQDTKRDSKHQPVTTKEKGHGTSKEYIYGNIKTKRNSSSRKSRSQTKSVGGSKKRLYRLSSSDSTSPMRSPSRENVKSPSSAAVKNPTNLTLKDFARSTLKNQPKPTSLTRPEMKSPTRMEMKSPTRMEMKSPTRVGMKNSDRMEMKSPTRARMKSPMRVQMRSPKSTGMKSPTMVEIKSVKTGRIRSPTSAGIKSPTRVEIKSRNRVEMKSPTRVDIKSPMREQMRSPTRAGMKSPTRPSMSALKIPKKSTDRSPTRSINKRLSKRKSEEKVIKSESKSSKDHPLPSASVSKDKRLVSSQSSKNSNTASNKKKRVYDDPCSELFKPDVIIVKKPLSKVPSDSIGLPLPKSKVMSFSKSSDYDNKHSKDKLPTTSFQKHYKLQSHNKAAIESKPASSNKPTELSTKASAEVLEVPGQDQMKTLLNDQSEDSIDAINKEALNVFSDGNSINNGASKVSCDNELINKEAPKVSSYDTDDLFSKESTFSICFPAKTKNEISDTANTEVTGSLVKESELNYSKYDCFSEENKSLRDSSKTSTTSADSTNDEFKVGEKSDPVVVNQDVLIVDSLMTEKDNDFKHLREVDNTWQSHSSPKAAECTTLTSSNRSSERLLLSGGELADAQITVLPETVKFDKKIVKAEASQCESNEVPCDAMKADKDEVPCDAMKADKDSSSHLYCSLGKPVDLKEEILEEEGSPHMVPQSSGSVTEVQLSNSVQLHIKNYEQASETDHLIIENSIFCSKETGGDNFSFKNTVSKEEDTPKMIESQSTVHSFTSYHSDDFKLTNNCADIPHDSPIDSIVKKEFLSTTQNHTSKDLETEVINSLNKSIQLPQIHPQVDQTEDSVDKAMEEMFSCDVPTETSTEINLECNNCENLSLAVDSSTENQLSILNDDAYKTVLPKDAVIKEMQSVVPEVDSPINHSDNYSSAVVQQEVQMSENLSNVPEFPYKDDDHTGSNNNAGGSSDFLEITVKPVNDENIIFDTAPGDKDASTAIKTDPFSLSCDTVLTNNCSDSTTERETNSFGVNEGLTENESQHDPKIKAQVENSEDGNVNDQSKLKVNTEKTSDETVVSSEEQVPHLPNTPLDNTQMQVFENTQPHEVSQPQGDINLTSDASSIKPIFYLSASVSEISKQRVIPFVLKTEPHFRSIDLTEEEDLGEVGAEYPTSEIVISHDSGSDLPEADSLPNEKQPPVECNYTNKLGVESEVVISSESDGKLQSNEEASQNTQTVSSEILINESDYKIEASDNKINVADESLASEIVIDSESEDKSSLSFNFNDQTTSEVVITAESSDKTEEDIYNFDRPIVTTQVSSETTQLPPVTTLSFEDVKLNVTNPTNIILPRDYPNIAVPDDFLTPDKIKEIFKQGDPNFLKTQNPPQTSTLIRPIVVPPQSLLGNELNPTQTLIAGGSSLSQGFASQDVVTMELDINSMPIVIDDSPEDDVPSTSTSSSLLNQCSSSDNISTVRIAMLPANRRPAHVPYNYYIKLVEPGSCKPKPQSGCVVMGIPAAKSNSVATVQHQSTKTVQFVSQGHLTRSEEYKEYIIATSQGKKKIMLQNIDEFPTKSVFKPVSLAKSRVRTVANSRTRRIVSSQNIVNVQPTTVVPPQVRVLPDSGTKKNLNYRTAVRSESNKKVAYRETNLSIAPNILANKKKSILKPTNKTVTIRMDRTIKDHRSSSPFVKPPGILKVCDRSVAGRRLIASPKPCLDSPDQSTSAVKKHRNPSRPAPKEDILAKALADTQVFQETEVSDTPETYIEPTLFRSVSSNVPSMALDSSLVTSPDITTNVSYNIASTSFGQHAIIQPSMPLLSDEAALSQSLSVQNSQSAIPIFQLGCSPYLFAVASKTKATTEGVSSISQASNFNSNMITCSSSETGQQAVSNPTQLTADINLAEIELPPGQPPNEPSSSNVFNDITTIPLPPEPFNNTLSPSGFLANPTDNICNSPDNHNLTSLFQGVSNTHIS